MSDVFPFALIVVLAVGLGVCGFIFWKRRLSPAPYGFSEIAAALREKAATECDLAVEREKSSRILPLESMVSQLSGQLELERESRVRAERGLASEAATNAQHVVALEEAKRRINGLETQLSSLLSERARLANSEAEKVALLQERAEALTAVQLELAASRDQLQVRSVETTRTVAQIATLKETLEQERKNSAQQLQLLNEAKDAMTNQFTVLANDLMARHGEKFAKQNKEQIDGVLVPLRERIVEFQQGLQQAHADSAKDRTTLGEQIKQLSETSARMTTETSNLTRALKGKSHTQGAWGEMILATLLQKSGLREGEEYRSQITVSGEDGRRLRPDVIIDLPGGEKVVIDSKVSLVAFEAHLNADSETDRTEHLSRHLESVRTHIKALSSKEYQATVGGSLNYVLMFIPIEGALAVAVQADPDLTSFAVQHNVAITTPTTLMIALRTIDSLWKVERRNQNAEDIAEKAGKLYNKFVAFVDDLSALGNRLTQAQNSYQGAFDKLARGPGNLVRQIEGLKSMGAKTTKSLPRALLGEGEEGAQEIASQDATSDTHSVRRVSS